MDTVLSVGGTVGVCISKFIFTTRTERCNHLTVLTVTTASRDIVSAASLDSEAQRFRALSSIASNRVDLGIVNKLLSMKCTLYNKTTV